MYFVIAVIVVVVVVVVDDDVDEGLMMLLLTATGRLRNGAPSTSSRSHPGSTSTSRSTQHRFLGAGKNQGPTAKSRTEKFKLLFVPPRASASGGNTCIKQIQIPRPLAHLCSNELQ